MKDAFISIRRTPYQSLASFLVLFLTTYLSICLLTVILFLYGYLNYTETQPQVVVYFQSKVAEADIFKVRDTMMNSNKVLSIKYVSKAEAFKIYKDSNKNNPLLLEMTPSDILPPSLEIKAKSPEFITEILTFVKAQPGVDEVQFQKDLVDRLLVVTSNVRKAAIIFFLYLMVTAVIVLMTITTFKIAMKREEIEILRLLGASNMFIKKPILTEGLILGFFAGVASMTMFSLGIFLTSGALTTWLSGVTSLQLKLFSLEFPIWPFNWMFFTLILTCNLIFAIGISSFASFIASDRYLKK
jgi:cell division transport system permease protein